MEATATASITGTHTIAQLVPRAAAAYADNTAVRYKRDGAWQDVSYAQLAEIVQEVGLGLIDVGLEPGERICILANTRPEWTYADMGATSTGAVVVPIYQTNSPEECLWVISDSGASTIVCENEEQMAKVLEIREQVPNIRTVISMEDADGEAGKALSAITLEQVRERGRGRSSDELDARRAAVRLEDPFTFIYTSGTTGPPKGCILTHGNYSAMIEMLKAANGIHEDEIVYLYLPLAHSFALLIQLSSFDLGATIAYWEGDPNKIVPNLVELKPTYFPSVPRIFEKIFTAANSGMEKQGGVKKAIFDWSIRVGKRMRETERAGRKPGFLLQREYAFADKKVLSKIRGLFGGNLRLAISGAAPINPDILRFFDAAGVLVVEGWGMTETSTAATISSEDDFKVGTIGKPFPGCEVKIAEDGEILVHGPNVFQGYHKNPEATAETIVDGWLHTGDIGEIDSEGFIKITGRKKDIITAGGKNITPANLEAEIKQHPLVSQCVIVGDRRPYLVALVTLDPEEAATYAAEHNLSEDPVQLTQNPDVKASIEAHVEKINENFARVEQVKKIAILPNDLSQESGELTPTLKVKRAVVAQKHEGAIEQLYAA